MACSKLREEGGKIVLSAIWTNIANNKHRIRSSIVTTAPRLLNSNTFTLSFQNIKITVCSCENKIMIFNSYNLRSWPTWLWYFDWCALFCFSILMIGLSSYNNKKKCLVILILRILHTSTKYCFWLSKLGYNKTHSQMF